MLPQAFANQIKAAGKRRIAKAAILFAGERRTDRRGQRFLRIVKLGLGLGQRAGGGCE
jgi:hypothetical protein